MNGYQKKRVLALLDAEDKLTAWEWDFINNLADRDKRKELTPGQNHWLNKIAEKVQV